MKFALFLAFLILFSSVISRKVKRHHTRHRGNPMAKTTIVYQFLIGALSEIGGDNKWIDECSQTLPGLEAAATKEESEKKVEKEIEKPQSTLQKALPYLGKGIDFLCGYKDEIKAYLNKQLKRYIRLFIQGKTRRKTFAWDGNALWEAVKTKAKDYGDKIKSGVAKVGSTIIGAINFVCKTIEDIQNFMKEQILKIFKPLIDLFEEIKKEFLAFLNENPVIKAFFEFVQCLYKNQEAIKKTEFLSTLKAFDARIKSLSNVEGWINFAVDMICAWSDLAEVIGYLKSAKDSTDAKVKYNYLGKFLGKLILTLKLEEEKKR